MWATIDDVANDGITWDNYEELTRTLLERIAAHAPVTTTRLERNLAVLGRATSNQVDVLWEFRDVVGQPIRLVFECRSYARPITQQALHSWRSVIDDIRADGILTVGVMVTRTGYQAGARRVAETYGIVILELRRPAGRDLEGRVASVTVGITARMPQVRDFQVQAADQLNADAQVTAFLGELSLEHSDGRREPLMDVLFDGELKSISEDPTPFHRVVRRFDPPVVLFHAERPVARIAALAAEVGETEAEPTEVVIRGLEQVAWVLKNTITGAHIWFAADRHFWATES